MRRILPFAAALLLTCSAVVTASAQVPPARLPERLPERIDTASLPSYRINATLLPDTHELSADVTLEFPANAAGTRVEFLLAAPLAIESSQPTAQELPAKGAGAGFTGINGSSAALSGSGRARRWQVQLPAGQRTLTLRYRGRMDFGFDTPEQEYARGFSETAGTLGPKGVYLAGSSLWYPWLGDTLFTFDQTESTNGSSTADMFAVMFTACRKTKSFATPILKSRLVVKKPSPNRTFGLACCVAFITLRIRREFGRQ